MSDIKMIEKEIEKLKQDLRRYEFEYYALESPTISDYEYDVLLKRLIFLENQYPHLKTDDSPSNKVGGYVSEKFEKVKHDYPMLSLGNAFDENDLIKFDSDIKKATNSDFIEYVVEPKIDGLSISLKYKNKKFVQAVTRGDGVTGEDVTENVKTIKGIPLQIDFDQDVEIRGEVYLTKENFKKINEDKNLVKKFANARNAASGSLRNLDSKITASRNLSGLFYYVPNALQDYHINSQFEVIEWLKKNKIPTSIEIKKYENIKQVIERVKEITLKRDDFKFDIDGIVIKVNQFKYYDEIGYTSKFPKWAIAYKFPANVKTTKLLSIDVTVGRTGKINYIANVAPVLLDGSMISKATLHNAEYILEKNIMLNDEIEIYKAGDIIPKIIRPIKEKRDGSQIEFKVPTTCPSCNSELKQFENEVDLYCLNENCKEKIIQQINHFCSREAMNIEGLSESIVKKLYENNLISNFHELYELKNKKEQILSLDLLIKEKSFNNLINAIEKSKSNSMERLLFGLGIRHVGFNVAKLLAKRFKIIDELAKANIADIEAIGDVGTKIANSIVVWFSKESNLQLISYLANKNINMKYINEYENVAVSSENEIYKNKAFVITGSFSKSRNEIKNILESIYDAKVSSSVTKKTNYLIVGKNPTANKIEKANSLNVPILKDEFWNNN